MIFLIELKKEHKQILELFKKIEQAATLDEKKSLIKKLKKISLLHLQKEENIIYPVLEKSKIQEITRLGKVFLETMQGYANDYLSTVDKILESEGEVPPALADAFKKSRHKIIDRITIEETILFPAVEMFCGSDAKLSKVPCTKAA